MESSDEDEFDDRDEDYDEDDDDDEAFDDEYFELPSIKEILKVDRLRNILLGKYISIYQIINIQLQKH